MVFEPQNQPIIRKNHRNSRETESINRRQIATNAQNRPDFSGRFLGVKCKTPSTECNHFDSSECPLTEDNRTQATGDVRGHGNRKSSCNSQTVTRECPHHTRRVLQVYLSTVSFNSKIAHTRLSGPRNGFKAKRPSKLTGRVEKSTACPGAMLTMMQSYKSAPGPKQHS
jgi:hypothetical protein